MFLHSPVPPIWWGLFIRLLLFDLFLFMHLALDLRGLLLSLHVDTACLGRVDCALRCSDKRRAVRVAKGTIGSLFRQQATHQHELIVLRCTSY